MYKQKKKLVEQAKRQNLIKMKNVVNLQSRDKEAPESSKIETLLTSIDLNDDEIGIQTPLQSQQVTLESMEIENVKNAHWKAVDILKMRKNYLDAKEYLVRWQRGANVFDSYHAWELESDLSKTLIRKYHLFKL